MASVVERANDHRQQCPIKSIVFDVEARLSLTITPVIPRATIVRGRGKRLKTPFKLCVGHMTRISRRRQARRTLFALLAAQMAAASILGQPAADAQQNQQPMPQMTGQPHSPAANWSNFHGGPTASSPPVATSQPTTRPAAPSHRATPASNVIPGSVMPVSATMPLPTDHQHGGHQYGGHQHAADTDIALRTIQMPGAFVNKISELLEVKYRGQPHVQISPDVAGGRLIIMAPAGQHAAVQADAMRFFAAESQPGASGVGVATASAELNPASAQQVIRTAGGAMQVRLSSIDWRHFEASLQQVAGKALPVTTHQDGQRAVFQLTGAPLDGTTIEVDRRQNMITVVAPEPAMPAWQTMIRSLDQASNQPGEVVEMVRVANAKPAPVQRAIRLLDQLSGSESATLVPMTGAGGVYQTTAFQPPGALPPVSGADEVDPNQLDDEEAAVEDTAGVIGNTQIQFVPELGIFIVSGARKDTQRVIDVIKQIEEQSALTQPEVEIRTLQHLDNTAAAALLTTLYEDVLAARQGEVSITALDQPNALLLIGRREALANALGLIDKLDQPLDANSKLRVFRLNHASATDAEEMVRNFFVERPGSEESLRGGLGSRVRILADYRTNSLIVGAAPRDLNEVAMLLNQLDVESVPAEDEIKVFPLRNSLASELAPVLQNAINGEGESTANENATRPSKSLKLLSLDAENGGVLNSGLLTGLVVTADSNANALIVRGPASSMSLIAELVRQLDQVPGVETVVKVFTIENGDAVRLATTLQELFAQTTTGTGAAGGATVQLSPATSSSSSLVNLRFSTDQRTNSIIATGSVSDLEVVESILLRLDNSGFAERITEVIWLRHQRAPEIAAAIQNYVQMRTQTVNVIQQFQQGLGPFDLPDRDLVVVAEEATNSLLLSVSPRLYDDVRRLIDNLDRRPPMVLIKVVLAEVTLSDAFELGGELGLQDSLLFDRGRAIGLPNSTPGFNFNGNGTPNVGVVDPGTVASRAVSTFGMGTTSSAAGYGGFVLSAASDSFSFLLRSLQDAGRAQILSRPQIMTVDNKEGFVNVGGRVARPQEIQQVGVSGNPLLSIEDIEVGLTLNVLPRVGADGMISMEILASRSSVDRTPGNGQIIGSDQNGVPIFVPDINETRAQSTIVAYSGQTVVFGGLIQKERMNQSRRVPYLSQIPLLGVMFRYDIEEEVRKELLIIMTPMLVNGDEDLEYVKQVESSRMSYCLADMVEMHGDVGLSGGYGLWGPAIGPTIYPDLHPTVDQFPSAMPTEIYGEPIYDGPALQQPHGAPMPLQSPAIEGVPTPAPQLSPGISAPSAGVPGPASASHGHRSLPSVPADTQQAYNRAAAAMRAAQPRTLDTGAVTTAAGPGNGHGTPISAADFKFIDNDTAAQLSGGSAQ